VGEEEEDLEESIAGIERLGEVGAEAERGEVGREEMVLEGGRE
jgi:hypothetical protein